MSEVADDLDWGRLATSLAAKWDFAAPGFPHALAEIPSARLAGIAVTRIPDLVLPPVQALASEQSAPVIANEIGLPKYSAEPGLAPADLFTDISLQPKKPLPRRWLFSLSTALLLPVIIWVGVHPKYLSKYFRRRELPPTVQTAPPALARSFSPQMVATPQQQRTCLPVPQALQDVGKHEMKIHFSSDVLFEPGRFDLLPESEVALNDVVEQIRHKPEVVVEMRGYTDSRGSREYNLALSTRRAQSVKEYLMRQGLQDFRLIARGFGSNNPVAPNARPGGGDNAEGRRQNRRVEIVIREE